MSELAELAALVARASGLRMGPHQMASLAAAMERAGHGDSGAALRAVTDGGDAAALQRLIDEVTVQETFFLRDAAQLATIDWRALLRRARRRGAERIRVWSAACATGEEPYTLAILAAEALGRDAVHVEILGTDIATAALARARRGGYQPRALRHLDPSLIERHFTREGDEFVVAPHLRAMVGFRQHNLATDAVPPPGAGTFDLVLCRNALIYFRAPIVERVAALLARALQPDGTLLLGAADRLCVAQRPSGGTPPSRPPARRVPRVRRRIRRHAPHARAATVAAPREPAPDRAGPEADVRGSLAAAVRLADAGRIEDALIAARAVLQHDPMNAAAEFICGSAELARGDANAAAAALRRALYIDGAFAQAAFQLGRAYDALGHDAAARRAYERAVRTFDPTDDRHDWLLGQVDVGDLAAACRTRLQRDNGAPPCEPLAGRPW